MKRTTLHMAAAVTSSFYVAGFACLAMASEPIFLNRYIVPLPTVPQLSESKRITTVDREVYELRLGANSGDVKFELGKMPAGVETDVGFVVTNASDETLEFLGVESSCGCLVAVTKDLVLEPNEESIFFVRLTTPKVSGSFEKLLTLKFKSPARELAYRMQFAATARWPIEVKNTPVNLEEKDGRRLEQGTLIILSNFQDVDLREFDFDTTQRFIVTSKVEKQDQFVATLTLFFAELSNVPVDQWTEIVRLSRGNVVLETPLTLHFRGRFFAKPSRVLLTLDGDAASARILIAASSKEDVVEVIDTKLNINGHVVDGFHEIVPISTSGRLGVFKVNFDHMRQFGDVDRFDAQLAIYVKGQELPIVLVVEIVERIQE